MPSNATLWNTVTRTLKGNGPKLADWSKGISIALRSCFCSLLTSNWEVSTTRSFYSLIILLKLHKTSSSVRILKTLKQIVQLKIEPCMYLHDNLKRLLAKSCFDVSFMCLSRFVAFRVIFSDLCC